jgi:hypothetical protein
MVPRAHRDKFGQDDGGTGEVAGGGAEAGPSEAAVELIRRARTPLFLPSDENTEPSEEGSMDENMDVEEDVDEDVEEADEMDVDQTLQD